MEMLNRRTSNRRISKARKTVRRSYVRYSTVRYLAFSLLWRRQPKKAKPQNIEQANFEGRRKTKERAFDVHRSYTSFFLEWGQRPWGP